MYVGSTLTFAAGALWHKRPAGLLLTAIVWIVYTVALRYERWALSFLLPRLTTSTAPLHLKSTPSGSVSVLSRPKRRNRRVFTLFRTNLKCATNAQRMQLQRSGSPRPTDNSTCIPSYHAFCSSLCIPLHPESTHYHKRALIHPDSLTTPRCHDYDPLDRIFEHRPLLVNMSKVRCPLLFVRMHA